MKLAIIGSRGITEGIEPHIPAEVTLIITGGAVGVDSLAEAYADRKKISKLVIRPDYQKYGKAAPIVRNKQIIEAADSVLVFWDGVSKGTKQAIAYAKKAGKPLTVLRLSIEFIPKED